MSEDTFKYHANLTESDGLHDPKSHASSHYSGGSDQLDWEQLANLKIYIDSQIQGENHWDLDSGNILVPYVSGASIALGLGEITAANLNITNWDTAYGWGNHALAGYLTAIIVGHGLDVESANTVLVDETELDDTLIPFSGSGITATNIHDAITELYSSIVSENHWDIESGDVLVPHITGASVTLSTGTLTAAALKIVNTITEISLDGTLAGDSDDALPTEKAVKTYVDAQIGIENHWDVDSGTILIPHVPNSSIDLGSGDFTTTGTVTAEQLTSTNDITMQGHLFTLGSDGSYDDIVLSFKSAGNDATITYNESDDTFEYGNANILSTGTIQGTILTDGSATINGGSISAGVITGTQYNLNDGNTYISEDGSGNMSFRDVVTGVILLGDLIPYSGADTAVDLGSNTLTTTGTITAGSLSTTVISLTDSQSAALDITEGANSYLKFDTSAEKLVFGKPFDISGITVAEDSGAVEFLDMSVSASPAAGTEQSYAINIDDTTILKIYSEADGSGSIQNPGIQVTGSFSSSAGVIDNTTRVTTTYQILVTDHVIYCDTDGGAFTVTLPTEVEGQHFKIINCGTSGNALTVEPSSSGVTIYAETSQELSDGDVIDLHYNATEGWY